MCVRSLKLYINYNIINVVAIRATKANCRHLVPFRVRNTEKFRGGGVLVGGGVKGIRGKG